jgi:hypothetical protein
MRMKNTCNALYVNKNYSFVFNFHCRAGSKANEIRLYGSRQPIFKKQ